MQRLIVVAAAVFYSACLRFAHAHYLSVEWAYFGFPISVLTPGMALAIFGATLAAASVLPARCQRVSDLFLWLLYLLVVAPGIVVTAGLGASNFSQATVLVIALTAGFCLSAVLVRTRISVSIEHLPGQLILVDGAVWIFVVAWWLTAVLLVWTYRGVMTFPELGQVYEQRAAGSAERNTLLAYAQLYFANVFSPALLTIGLFQRRFALVIFGIAGCVLMYCITAQRTAFAMPFAMLILWHVSKSRRVRKYFTALSMCFLSCVVMLATLSYKQSKVSDFLSVYLTFRTIGIPGLTLSQYFTVFDDEGYTKGSHIKGIASIVPAPKAYANDPGWPSLGYIVADRIYGSPQTNLNANLYAGDGIASAGVTGLMLISLVLALWLRLLDGAIPPGAGQLAIFLMFPTALALTNAPLSTTMVSFGGLFWTVFFLGSACVKLLKGAPAVSDAKPAPPDQLAA